MNSLSEKTWEIEGEVIDDIFSIFSSDFNVNAPDLVVSKFDFLDDFDSHLWRAGYLFYKTNNKQFKLVDSTGRVDEINASSNARFWWDFSGDKNVLQKLLGLRAVMPVASLKFNERNYLLCNEDQKVVAKACLTQLILENTTINFLTLKSLRGYKKYFNRAEKSLEGLTKKEISNFGLKTLLVSHAIQAFEVNKTNEKSITADMPAEDAVRLMALGLLDSAKLHVNGTIKDIDTEFLHQFRVNLRKLRSLISLLKKALPQETVEVLKGRLALIARTTNALRDLDVFLLDENNYRKLLPENFDDGLSELYALIRKQRKTEHRKIINYFSSKHYSNEVLHCTEVLSLAPVYEGNISAKPILQVAKKLLLNRYHKMLAMSANTNSQSADDDVHALRIEFKKFRYLIEFFIDLLPKKEIAKLVDDIKKIQSVLGGFNDYATQIMFLKTYIDDERIEMSKSLSGLIAVLHQKQLEEKRKVTDALAGFFTEKTNNKIDTIFGSGIQGDLA